MNALSSLLGILIAAVAFWGTVQNLSKAPHKHVRTEAKEAPTQDALADDSVRVKGRVVDANGDPVSGVMVVVRPIADSLQQIVSPLSVAGDDALTDALTDGTGQFVLAAMIPGNYSVIALHGGHPPGVARLVVSEDDCPTSTSVEIVLNRADELLTT